jgi:hypothetical protein
MSKNLKRDQQPAFEAVLKNFSNNDEHKQKKRLNIER